MSIKNVYMFILIATILAQATLVPAAGEVPLQAAPASLDKTYIVGDSKGWTNNVNYEAWVTGKDFYMGDHLIFNFPKDKHNVVKVDEAGYKSCTVPAGPHEVLATGKDDIRLLQMGGIGFISSVGEDCKNGMKLFLPNVKCPYTRPRALMQAGRKLVPSNI